MNHQQPACYREFLCFSFTCQTECNFCNFCNFCACFTFWQHILPGTSGISGVNHTSYMTIAARQKAMAIESYPCLPLLACRLLAPALHTHAAVKAPTAAAALAVPDDDSDEVCPGRLIEFKRDTRSGLALVERPDGKRNWIAVDARWACLFD